MDCKVIVDRRERVWDGFLKVDRVSVRHSTFDGSLSPPLDREVVERGDSVSVLLHDPARDVVVLVEQFRMPAHERGSGWLLEAQAGVHKDGEDPELTVRRETREETGLIATHIEHVCTMFPSPGGLTERMSCYYATVDASTIEDGKIAGEPSENEDIRVRVLPRSLFLQRVKSGAVLDGKTLLLGYWMLANEQGR